MTHEEIMEKYKREILSKNPNGNLGGFLIQVNEDNDFMYDFCYGLSTVDNFYNWQQNIETGISYNKATLEDVINRKEGDWWNDCVPVGSNEFVFAYIDAYCPGMVHPDPLNVPDELAYVGKCNRFNLHLPEDKEYLKELIGEGNKFCIKSNTLIKNRDNGIYDNFGCLDSLENMENCQVSTYIDDINAEFRCFVYLDNLAGIERYSGDLDYNPDPEKVRELIRSYKYDFGYGPGRPAYTLDIALCGEDDRLEVIECHDFYSCGLYGFHGLELPHMFKSSFNYLKRKFGKLV